MFLSFNSFSTIFQSDKEHVNCNFPSSTVDTSSAPTSIARSVY
uniref:Uncharacterized protein n=1 Tax=Ciona intestinalis TaxID=7719 RepID=H2XXM7_CIOIN